MTPPAPSAREHFLELVRTAVAAQRCEKIVLGKPRDAAPTLQRLTVRPVVLRGGPRLSFVWSHQTSDVTKNFSPSEGCAEIERLLGSIFQDAHLFASDCSAQLLGGPGGPKLRVQARSVPAEPLPPAAHDRPKHHLVPADRPWLQALGVTNPAGRPREGLAGKYRQIQKFAEILQGLLAEAGDLPDPVRVADMGCGKGYLTFALADLLGARGRVTGVETRAALVAEGNRVAAENGFGERLQFRAGTIADFPVGELDVLIALHACDTATDDALAHGVAAGARLLVVSPCCQQELRPQLAAPPVLAPALRHGIFQERQAEFATDALRAGLLDWAGYRTRVFEFIATEHTAKNLMIAAVRERPRGGDDDAAAHEVRDLARFYGIHTQALARRLGFPF